MLTLEITVESLDDYLAILRVLDVAADDGKLDCEYAIRPDLQSLQAIAEHELGREKRHEIPVGKASTLP